MYNCYNEAITWLKKQKKKRVKTKDGYVYVEAKHHDHDAKVVDALLGQYYYGIQAKKELYHKMIDLGVIKEKVK